MDSTSDPKQPKQSWKRSKLEVLQFLISKFTTILQKNQTVWYQHADRHVDRSNTKESQEINPCIYLNFDNGAKTVQWGKQSLQLMVLGKFDIHIQRKRQTLTYLKIKWIRDVKMRAKTTKLFTVINIKNMGESFMTLDLTVIS